LSSASVCRVACDGKTPAPDGATPTEPGQPSPQILAEHRERLRGLDRIAESLEHEGEDLGADALEQQRRCPVVVMALAGGAYGLLELALSCVVRLGYSHRPSLVEGEHRSKLRKALRFQLCSATRGRTAIMPASRTPPDGTSIALATI